MGLAEALVTVSQAERGGEVALRGFEYQASWGIDYLLEKQKERKDYLFLFEYHDDILILNSAVDPTAAEFVQVKTKKDGKWTLSAVSTATTAKPKSFISKLYEHFFQFVDYEINMVLLSNAGFDFLEDNAERGDHLSDENKCKIIKRVKEQLNKSIDIPLEKLKFSTSDLSLLSPKSHLIGKAAVFLNAYFGDNHGISAIAFTELLINKCNDRVKIASSDIKSFKDLVDKKGISSTFITELLSGLIKNISITPNWEHVCLLINDFKNPFEKIKMEAVFKRIATKVLNVNTLHYQYLVATQAVIDTVKNFNEMPLRAFCSQIEIEIAKKCSVDFAILDKDEMFMIKLYAIIKRTLEGVSDEK